MKDGGPNIFRSCLEEEENGSRFFLEIKGNSTPHVLWCPRLSFRTMYTFDVALLEPARLQESLKNNHQEILFFLCPSDDVSIEPRQKPIRSIPFVTLVSIVRREKETHVDGGVVTGSFHAQLKL